MRFFIFVRLSSTICVYRTAKWFKPFVRGTFETEKLRKLSGPDPWGTVRIEKIETEKLRKLSGPDPWGTVRIEKTDCSMPRKIVTKCEGSL